MFTNMSATPFDLEAPLGKRRAIIRREDEGVEMVEAAWPDFNSGTRNDTITAR